MKRFFAHSAYALMLIYISISFVSCNKGGSANSDSSGVDNDSTILVSETNAQPDSEKNDTTDNKKSNDAALRPQLKFATAEDALEYMRSSKDADKYAAGIIPHMATEELSYATKLLNNTYQRFLIVDKELMRVGLFDKYGREILSYGMACARNFGTKHRKADSRTPEGFFSVEGIYNSTDWLFTDDNGYTSPARGQFGPRFIRIKNPVTTQIGIHGTAAPGSIGRRCSHGCIRVKNENILELVKYVEPGMPVIITPSSRDQQINTKEGVHIAKVTMDPFGKYSVPSISAPVKSTNNDKTTKIENKELTNEEPVNPANSENMTEEKIEQPIQVESGNSEQQSSPVVEQTPNNE